MRTLVINALCTYLPFKKDPYKPDEFKSLTDSELLQMLLSVTFNAGYEMTWSDLEQTELCHKYEDFEQWQFIKNRLKTT